MTIGCNIWMICLILIWRFYGLSRMFQLPQFVWALRSSVWNVFHNFLLIDATDRSKISSDQKRFFIASSLYPLSFFTNTPFKVIITGSSFVGNPMCLLVKGLAVISRKSFGGFLFMNTWSATSNLILPTSGNARRYNIRIYKYS